LTVPKLLSSLLMRTHNKLSAGTAPNIPAAPRLADLCAQAPLAVNIMTLATTTASLKFFDLNMVSPFKAICYLYFRFRCPSEVITHGGL
jgi:hypothetical protein